MPEQNQEIIIRSEPVCEILSTPPKWIVRWGITVIFIIIAGLFLGSYFFKYPEIISAKVTIITENPPVALKSFTTGKITNFFVTENQQIEKNTVIAVIENTANYNDIKLLDSLIQNFNDSTILNFPDSYSEINLNLGDMQTVFAVFLRNIKAYQNFKILDYYTNKITATDIQIKEYQLYYSQLQMQLNILASEFTLSEKQYQREKNLYNLKVTAQAEYEQAEQNYLQDKRAYENFKSSLNTTQIQITQLEQQILDLKLQKIKEENDYELSIKESLETVKSQLLQWEKLYLIKTPIAGRVTFTELWHENQTVQSEQNVVIVVPNEDTKIIGKLQIPVQGAGKIKTRNTVNIKLDNYPYMEFGILKAKITQISLVPTESENGIFYTAEIKMIEKLDIEHSCDKQLITTYNKKLPFSQQMSGTAEIITEDLSLLDRFINPIKALFIK